MAKNEQSSIWSEYLKADEYDSAIGLDQEIEKNIDFYEGIHWGHISDNAKTKHLPRPVINLCQLVADTKISALEAGKTKLQFLSYTNQESATKLTRFVDYLLSEMEFEDTKSENIYDFIVKGSSVFHAYWDIEAIQVAKGHQGGIVIENIDTRNVKFSNPRLRDIQKNEWIIIRRTKTIEEVKRMCKNEDQAALIVANDEDDIGIKDVLPLLTKYYKKKDKETGIYEIWFTHATETTEVGEPTRLHNPVHCKRCEEEYAKSESDYLNDDIKPEEMKAPTKKFVRKANLFPLAFGTYLRREKQIKGRSIITDMINNQRAINFNLAMMLVSVQNNAWGQRVVKEGTLKGQVLTNDPSQVITDHYQGGKGVYSLTTQPFSATALALNQNIIDLVRIITGTTEVMTGEMKAGMSGVAIATLQERATKNIDAILKRYRAVLSDLGRVIEMFVAIFYDEMEHKVFYEQSEEDESIIEDEYIGTDYADVDYSVNVVATNGSQYSETVELQILQELFVGKAINFETYLKNIPSQIFPNKEKMLEELQGTLQAQLEQAMGVIEQLQGQMQKMAVVVNKAEPIMQENAKLKGTMLNLYSEYANKIKQANQQSKELDSAAQELAMKAIGGNKQ